MEEHLSILFVRFGIYWFLLLWCLSLSILFVRFFTKTSLSTARLCILSILFVRFLYAIVVQSPAWITFNSLCEIPSNQKLSLLAFYHFQFSLWDSGDCIHFKKVPRLLIFQFSLWDSYLRWRRGAFQVLFQFSLWDSKGFRSGWLRPSTFNSLCEIRLYKLYPFLLTLLSILFVRFTETPDGDIMSKIMLSILFVRFLLKC